MIDYDAAVDVPAGSAHGRALHTRRKVTWRVSDPVRVAHQGISSQDAISWIAHDIAHTGPESIGGDPDSSTAPGRQVVEAGITYRIRPSAPVVTYEAPLAPAAPSGWGQEQREAYCFYREVVGQGPQSLAALWLLHHPDQGREVLEWTVQNRSLLADQAQWESTLVGLLQGLGTEDRAFLGVKMAEILSELGVPQAAQVLDQMRGGQASAPHRARPQGVQ
ncbi:hypothetical protein [Kitasatospora sp. DSM 101779]|uniref:hypothetical protein n=1 Tax=Kitasatospora sp. DSM 101779 TaxID=2853165 RepID=UPI0021D9D038|nr:hypothetical protein [Kitasatospora sp. DSM 101779]MCU7821151.1 hypothetical protein [Kitasatospora sp. DSM 101779]